MLSISIIIFFISLLLINSLALSFKSAFDRKLNNRSSFILHSFPKHKLPNKIDPESESRNVIKLLCTAITTTMLSLAIESTFHPLLSAAATDKISVVRDIFAWRNGPIGKGAPIDAVNIMKSRFEEMRSGVTGEKISELRVGESLVARLRDIEKEMDAAERDIYAEDVDWEVLEVYPKIFRAYSPLFTAYTDRAFPGNNEIDSALRYALRYEVGGFYSGARDLEVAIEKKSQRNAEKAFSRMSIAFDHYIKAGDLYAQYDPLNKLDSYEAETFDSKLTYIAPGIDAPGIKDKIVLLQGPDKGREGSVLWISKGAKTEVAIVKLEAELSGHREVKTYPYSLVAKTVEPQTQFLDDLLTAYIASAIASGVMYPIDSFKTRVQLGKSGVPAASEGGLLGLWKGVQYFILDANDAIYVAVYSLIKPALLAPINPNNPTAVFWVLCLSGSLGDAIGSFSRLPAEIITKQIQTGTVSGGLSAAKRILQGNTSRVVFVSWLAILLRDVPFAGLQIAFYDFYKGLFAFLDEAGFNIYFQRLIWGAFAGSTAAYLTTPFDNLTTNIMTAAQDDQQVALPSGSGKYDLTAKYRPLGPFEGIGEMFISTILSIVKEGGPRALFTGAFARVLFFGPSAMIFFASYETLSDLLEIYNAKHQIIGDM